MVTWCQLVIGMPTNIELMGTCWRRTEDDVMASGGYSCEHDSCVGRRLVFAGQREDRAMPAVVALASASGGGSVYSMANPRQRRKARSSTHKPVSNPFSKKKKLKKAPGSYGMAFASFSFHLFFSSFRLLQSSVDRKFCRRHGTDVRLSGKSECCVALSLSNLFDIDVELHHGVKLHCAWTSTFAGSISIRRCRAIGAACWEQHVGGR